MTLGVFVTSTQGMLSQSHAMEQISANVANVNTVGYKKVRTLFSTQMTQNSQMNNDHLFSAGTVDQRFVAVAGALTSTNSVYDLSISGKGFFVVEKDGQQLYTRAGDFLGTAVPPEGYDAPEIEYYQPTNNAGVTTQKPSPNYLINSSGLYVMGWNVNPLTGEYSSSLEPVNISPPEYYPGHATSQMVLKGNIPADATTTQKQSFPVYDNDFNSHSMVMHWEPVEGDANAWNLTFNVEGATVTSPPAQIRFNENAQLVSPYPSVSMQIQWEGGGTSTVTVDISKMTQYATELNGEVLSQDGKPYGELVSRSWDSNGVLTAYYGNGSKLNVCKVAIAQVQVPNMMEAVSGNMFAYNTQAGDLEIVDLEETPDQRMTQVAGGSLEGSNVRLEDEFTNMIITQRAYSGSTNAFTTNNEMLQEAISILS